ncbi:MAG: hypothetical protein M3437_06795 [Chloroflexota bacterium]|nr:hypothetical protein [Chloroflexota bacterium]MDQ5866276.1 hypothetical protein [Chloroflexota bacterium]
MKPILHIVRTYMLSDLDVYVFDQEFTWNSESEHSSILVMLRTPLAGEIPNEPWFEESLVCESLSRHVLTDKLYAMFLSLSKDELPPGSLLSLLPKYQARFTKAGKLNRHTAAPFDMLPEGLQSFIKQTSQEDDAYAQRAIRLLRWRYGLSGPHNAFASSLDAKWSLDELDWLPLPRQGGLTTRLDKGLTLDEEVLKETETLLTQHIDEPIGHALYREAKSEISFNPRSSIALAISAVEAGFKQFVGQLVPDAQWLVENVQSPPLVAMLQDYLPTLPVRNTIQGKIVPIPEHILKALKKGATIRNKVIHTGANAPERKTLEEILDAVRDTLFILDYYAGYAWAIEHVSPATRQAMNV